MKLSWPMRLDFGYLVGQVIGGSFDNDYLGFVIALEALAETARAEIAKSTPVQLK